MKRCDCGCNSTDPRTIKCHQDDRWDKVLELKGNNCYRLSMKIIYDYFPELKDEEEVPTTTT